MHIIVLLHQMVTLPFSAMNTHLKLQLFHTAHCTLLVEKVIQCNIPGKDYNVITSDHHN